jgi:hypothetical protein
VLHCLNVGIRTAIALALLIAVMTEAYRVGNVLGWKCTRWRGLPWLQPQYSNHQRLTRPYDVVGCARGVSCEGGMTDDVGLR